MPESVTGSNYKAEDGFEHLVRRGLLFFFFFVIVQK